MLLKIIGLFCKRALSKRLYSAKENYHFKEPNNRLLWQAREVDCFGARVCVCVYVCMCMCVHVHTHAQSTHTRLLVYHEKESKLNAASAGCRFFGFFLNLGRLQRRRVCNKESSKFDRFRTGKKKNLLDPLNFDVSCLQQCCERGR